IMKTKEKQKRTAISYSLKKEICLFHQKNPNKTQSDIKDEFNSKYQLNLDRSTISKILSNKEKWTNLTSNETDDIIFRKSRVKHPSLEKALSIWVNQII
ncbi:36559_t:CDS:1, partial [Gigaspora margarita]